MHRPHRLFFPSLPFLPVTLCSDVKSDRVSTLTGHLTKMTGALQEDFSSDHCDVSSLHYFNEFENAKGGITGGRVYVKLVTNNKYQETDSGHTVKQFEDYIEKVHERWEMTLSFFPFSFSLSFSLFFFFF